MFRGNHPAKIDEKGRLKLPSAFKALVETAGVKEFYVTSLDGTKAEVWPLPEWEKREEQLAASSEFEPAVRKYLARTSYWGQQVEMDAQGRLVLPQLLRKKANLDEVEVTVIGIGSHLEVHNRQQYEAAMEADDFTVEDGKTLSDLFRRKD